MGKATGTLSNGWKISAEIETVGSFEKGIETTEKRREKQKQDARRKKAREKKQ